METEELLLNFMEMTNLPIEEAQRYLSEAQNSLELAIQNFYDDPPPEPQSQQRREEPAPTQNTSQGSTQSSSAFQESQDDGDEVRPADRREYSQLVEEESVRSIQLSRVKRQFNTNFRDLKKEMEIQENLANGVSPKKKCLEDIYRNPIDLTYNLDLHAAKHVGQKQGKWIALLINDENFPSLSFNRDIFNTDINQKVKNLIKKNFVFLRKNSDSEEGVRILQNYNLLNHSIPIFLIIDSLTGELKKNFGGTADLKLKTVVTELKKYSSTEDKQLNYTSDVSQDSDDEITFRSSSFMTGSSSSTTKTFSQTSTVTISQKSTTTTKKCIESDEESFASLKSDDLDMNSSDDDENEEAKVLDSDDEILKTEKVPQTNILLKLSDQSHNFKYPATRTVRHLIDYIYRNYLVQTGLYDDQRNRFSLFSKVHNKCITTIDQTQSLEDSKIHPSCCLMHNTIEKD